MDEQKSLKEISSYCKEYGFIFPSSEIYEGISAVYDYGWLGVELKNNLKRYWWQAMVQLNDNIVGLDASILMNPKVWQASGHVDNFADPLIDNKDSKKRYRADQLIEEQIQLYLSKAEKRRALELQQKLDDALSNDDLSALYDIITSEKILCPISKTCSWTEVKYFNLMFQTTVGASNSEGVKVYLRPETAQGIFTNFLNIQKTARQKLPFGIAQIGKAFRNEIVTRGFIIRMREFEQMEMQFFIKPDEDKKYFALWKEKRLNWAAKILNSPNKLRVHEHVKLAHYAKAAVDIEYDFNFGFKEIEGIHSRGDFDLKVHENFSGKKIRYFDAKTKESYIPGVIETSIGLDRLLFLCLYDGLKVENLENGDKRTVLKINPSIAPVKVAIFPLAKKENLQAKAQAIKDDLRLNFNVIYDEKDSIGKRYRRQDAIGTPFCITIDFESLQDDNVTIRNRDTMEQHKVNVNAIKNFLQSKIKSEILLNGQ